MNIKFVGDTKEISENVSHIVKEMGISVSKNGKEVELHRCDSGFSVTVTEKKAVLEYNTKTDFCRGFRFLTDALENEKNISVSQKPAFDKCGIMLDVSRGAVIKVNKVKEIVRLIAGMGFNQLMLYTEDVYEMKKYPYWGYMRGRYTEEELCDIVSYAKGMGIDTIPCIQTLGHLAYPLRWRAHFPMKESDAVLYIGEEETYELIEEMVKTMRRCFDTKEIHIGMDEAHGVGLGRYLTEKGMRNRFELLSEHLNRVLEICRKYDFAPMMWSDMFFRLGSKSNDYYDIENTLPENIAELIPDGISQVYWDYYNNSEKFYDAMLGEHKKMKCPIIFAGGVWTWGGPGVNNVQSFKSTVPALRSCLKQGVKNVFATLWGDDGSECDVLEALYGLQLFAEFNYNTEDALASVDEAFRICTGYDAELFKLFDLDDFGLSACKSKKCDLYDLESHIINLSKQILYQNPLMGMVDKNIEGLNLCSHYKTILNEIEKIKVPDSLKALVDSHKQLLKVLITKTDIGIKLKRVYDNKDMAELAELADVLSALSKDISLLRVKRRELWYENNKPFGFELVGRRLAAIEEFTDVAFSRVKDYVNGNVEKLDELEQDRLPYNSFDGPFFMEYFSDRIMMP